MPELSENEPSAETIVLDHVETESAASAASPKPVPWMPILVGVGVLVLVGLIIVIVLLLTRPATSTALPEPIASPTASTTPSASPSPSATSTPTPTPVAAAPAPEPAPVEPAPVEPALPEKTPLTVGIVSFSVSTTGPKTIAAECATVQNKAATDNSYILVRFSWVTKGLIDGGEIQVNGTYGGIGDLQGIGANESVVVDFKCFNTDGTPKYTDYTLLLSDGTQRYSRTITVSAVGVTG